MLPHRLFLTRQATLQLPSQSIGLLPAPAPAPARCYRVFAVRYRKLIKHIAVGCFRFFCYLRISLLYSLRNLLKLFEQHVLWFYRFIIASWWLKNNTFFICAASHFQLVIFRLVLYVICSAFLTSTIFFVLTLLRQIVMGQNMGLGFRLRLGFVLAFIWSCSLASHFVPTPFLCGGRALRQKQLITVIVGGIAGQCGVKTLLSQLTGMTKYRKGPQRSITQDHRGSAIMRKLPDLQQFCVFLKLFCFVFVIFVILYFLFFCQFFWSFSELWRFTKRPF